MGERICFVISPIGDPETDIRKRSDQVLRHIIKPAVEKHGYKAVRADEISLPGMITSQVIERVVNAPLVVADLTGHNPNVFYELAIRHAYREPLIKLIMKDEKIPFDVAVMRTISYDLRDPDSIADAKEEISKQILALQKEGAKVENPISVAVDLQKLRQSGDPQQRTLADILSAIGEVKNALLSMVSKKESQGDFVYVGSSYGHGPAVLGYPTFKQLPPGYTVVQTPWVGTAVIPGPATEMPDEIRKAIEAQERHERRNLRSESEGEKTEPKT